MGRSIVHFMSFTYFTQVKVKKAGMPHRMNFTYQKFFLLTQKYCNEIGIIIATN